MNLKLKKSLRKQKHTGSNWREKLQPEWNACGEHMGRYCREGWAMCQGGTLALPVVGSRGRRRCLGQHMERRFAEGFLGVLRWVGATKPADLSISTRTPMAISQSPVWGGENMFPLVPRMVQKTSQPGILFSDTSSSPTHRKLPLSLGRLHNKPEPQTA